MNSKKDILVIILSYLLVVLYVVLFNDIFGTIVFLLALMTFHIFRFSGLKAKLYRDKEDSILRLKSKMKKTEKENEDTYKRFISLTTILGSGVIMVDEKGIVNFINKDIKQFFDIDNINKDYNVFLKVKPLYKFINQAYLLDNSSRKQIQYEDKYYDLISTPIFENELFQGCLIIVHDITNLKTAENFQKQFTADVSHELKTPLSTIKGFAEILTRDVDMDKKDRIEFINLINKESERMDTILSDLLIISKMDRLDYELKFTKVNIKDLVFQNLDLLSQQLIKNNIKVNTQIEDCVLEVDKNKMGQVVLNLVRNAINYNDKGEINIIGVIKENSYCLIVKDNGIGILKENLSKIFKRFYRVDTARSRDSGGSGLGLSICKNIVLKHNGTISVKSEKNVGTEFYVELPLNK